MTIIEHITEEWNVSHEDLRELVIDIIADEHLHRPSFRRMIENKLRERKSNAN